MSVPTITCPGKIVTGKILKFSVLVQQLTTKKLVKTGCSVGVGVGVLVGVGVGVTAGIASKLQIDA